VTRWTETYVIGWYSLNGVLGAGRLELTRTGQDNNRGDVYNFWVYKCKRYNVRKKEGKKERKEKI